MLLDADHRINWAAYQKVWETAIDDLKAVLDPLHSQRLAGSSDPPVHEVYLRHFATRPDMTFGMVSLRIMEFVIECCRNKEIRTVRFLPAWDPDSVPLNGYVSWLVVDPSRREMAITYDPRQVEKVTPELDKKLPFLMLSSHNLVYVHDKILAKVILHELGHASLHLGTLRDKMQETGLAQVSLDKEHEPQAWLYALIVWGIFVGDHSYCSRATGLSDEGYVVC